MTVQEFNRLFNEIREGAVSSQGSLTYDLYTDCKGRKAGVYDCGYVHEITINGITWRIDESKQGVREVTNVTK